MSADSSVFAGSNMANGKLKRKRNRIPLSCTICRKRKVKCDKTRPNCEQCSKTGVAHLCHYMEQTWAEEAEKEISKDSELKNLKSRVRVLEEALVKAQSSFSHTPDSESPFLEQNSPQTGPTVSCSGRHDNDELDLTRQFDMLHLRNNGTIHLGATHWLAIMKGDPYLKLLWGHIFTMKEKLAEWYSHKKQNPHAPSGRCPVMPHTTKVRCPVDHRNMNAISTSPQPPRNGVGKCPVDHTALKKCPVDHTAMSKQFVGPSSASTPQYPPKREEAASGSPGPNQTSLPSIQNLTSKCPVLHDALPGIQDAVPRFRATKSEPTEHKLSSEQIRSRLCEHLPPKRIVCMFLEKFFKQIYPVIPILDELTFKNHINYMLSLSVNTETENITHIRMNKLADFCNLGILMIILRLTWLSLPINRCKIDLGKQCTSFFMPHATTASATQAKEEALLVKHETPAEALEIVRENLIKFEQISSISNSNVNLTTVQFAIFYKLYLMCWSSDSSPQNGTQGEPISFNSGDSQDNETHQMLLSTITQMAFSCGLHRDPDNFAQLTAVPCMHVDTSTANNNGTGATGSTKPNKDTIAGAERFKHAWRKTWYYIVSLDVQQSLSLGAPRLLRNLRDFSDTKLPSTSKLDYVNDIKELVIVKNATLFFQIDLCIIAVLNHVLNVSVARSVKKSQLDFLISSLSDLTHNNKNICEVLDGLINNGLLHSAEGAVDSDPDSIYGIPSLREILSQQSLCSSENDVDRRLDLAYESATRALFFSKHLTLRVLLYLLNYILFTHYEPMGVENPDTASIAKSYAQETLNYAMDGYRNCMFFFTNVGQPSSSNSMFNYMEVVLAPQCLDVGHRALQFIVCLILRAKCGPLTGMGESAIIGNNGASSNSEEESEQTVDTKKENTPDATSDINEQISLDTGELLADTLYSKMVLFHKLTKQICIKYHYALRTMKSTGFFIALLRDPSQKSKRDPKSERRPKKHSRFTNMTGLFKNVPSLILSGDGEQLKRCPVYQDAIGFVAPRIGGHFSSGTNDDSVRSGLQLPPLKAYKPITYVSSSVRTERQNEESKRRRLNNGIPLKTGDLAFGPLGRPVASPKEVTDNFEPLPPLERLAGKLTPMQTTGRGTPVSNPEVPYGINGPMTTGMDSNDMSAFASPASENSLSDLKPSFEDFLTQNANFNGIMINPSSIVEAVGFQNFGIEMPMANDAVDFLPLDSTGIDELAEVNGTQFPSWNN